MKKQFRKFSVLFAAAALMASCSNDEPNPGSNVPENVKGMDAYMRVNIQDAGDMLSRDGDPTSGDLDKDVNNGDYEFGKGDENAVSSAKFYFYTADKVFTQEGTLTEFKPSGSNPDNIEVFGQKVLVLKGLTTNTTPKYMVTVLNAPADFEPGATLDDTRAAISAIRNGSNFVMSTTSFVDAKFTDEYGTNMLTADDFLVQPAGTVTPDNVFETNPDLHAVEVYVERLAAKVEVRSAVELNEDGYVKLTVPVAGDPNSQGGAQATTTEVFVKLSKWGLSSTAKESYMIKNIAGLDGSADVFEDWNAPKRYRSFWGKSRLWDQDVTTENANFTSYAAAQGDFNKDVAYCAENTNVLDRIAKDNLTKDRNLTSVLFTATVYEKNENGEYVELDMVRYNGSLYKTGWFKDFVLNYLKVNGKHNYYKLVPGAEGTNPEYVQLDADELGLDLVFADENETNGAGNVKVVSTLTAEKYAGLLVKDADGDFNPFTAADLTTLNSDLASFDNKENKPAVAEGYKDGMMYYDIPIEHLVKTRGENNNIVVGNYGVVRNHWYLLTVDKIMRLGSGVFDPDKTIIPPLDPKDPTYYIGARINILSWKIVTQNVEL